MTRRELNLAIFEGKAEKVLWQPRLETWISHHMSRGTLPARFRGMSSLEIYDALGCSVRYAASTGIEVYEEPADVVRKVTRDEHYTVETIRTPSGEIRTVWRDIWKDGRQENHRIIEYPVKRVEDLKVVVDLIDRQQFRAHLSAFREAEARVGHRGEPTIFLSSSGFTELIKNWIGLAGTYYMTYDHPRAVEEYLEACDRRDDRLIEVALQLPCRLFNLGDHATNEFSPPPILKKYLLPRWQRIADRLHRANRFVHTHWDGMSRLILPFLQETHLDGVEALTPAPMGDISLEQIKEAVGDRLVVLDLLPAIDFLEYRPLDALLDFARRCIDMFAPRLILGISDEISQTGQIEKVEAVTGLVDKTCGLAD